MSQTLNSAEEFHVKSCWTVSGRLMSLALAQCCSHVCFCLLHAVTVSNCARRSRFVDIHIIQAFRPIKTMQVTSIHMSTCSRNVFPW